MKKQEERVLAYKNAKIIADENLILVAGGKKSFATFKPSGAPGFFDLTVDAIFD